MTYGLKRPLTRRDLGGLAFAALLAAASPAQADTAAETYVKKIAADVMALANTGEKGKALRGRFAALMNRYINLKGIADYALGPYNKKLPAGDRTEFYQLVSNYAAALFVYYVEDFRGTELEIISTTKQGKFTIIHSAITGQGRARAGALAADADQAAVFLSAMSISRASGCESR